MPDSRSTTAGLAARLDTLFGDRAGTAQAIYERRYPDASPSRRYIQAFSDLSIMQPTLAQADRMAATGATVYTYRFDRQSPALGGKLGRAAHQRGALCVRSGRPLCRDNRWRLKARTAWQR